MIIVKLRHWLGFDGHQPSVEVARAAEETYAAIAETRETIQRVADLDLKHASSKYRRRR